MVKQTTHIIFYGLLLVFFYGCTEETNKKPDLRESFSYRDPRPFGTSVAYAITKNIFTPQKVDINKTPFADNYGWDYDTASLYINISRNYYVTERDAESLLDFVYKGNTAFISADNYDTLLLNKLYCKQNEADFYSKYMLSEMRNTSSKLTDGLTIYDEKFSYFYFPFSNYFKEINGSYARIVGYNDAGKANFFVFLWGKGRVYFHNEPRTFSNYFLLTKNNYLYLQSILQMMPARPLNIYWDNYYSNKNYVANAENKSTLDTIMKYPPLAKAFFIAIGLLLLYIFFNSKRRQRIVPVIKPTQNTSIAFAEAIAGLYLNKKDNKIIAEKIITYFNEHVRSKYFVTINVNDPNYADTLSRKSGVAFEIVDELTATIKTINNSPTVSDEQLLHLNGLTEKFFKNK